MLHLEKLSCFLGFAFGLLLIVNGAPFSDTKDVLLGLAGAYIILAKYDTLMDLDNGASK